jgi:heme-degrading monooxygenase HmoA
MTKRLGRFLLYLFGLLLLLPIFPAWADKVVEPLVFKADDGAIAVISLYETSPTTQTDAVKSFYKIAKSFYKAIPGFYGLALFSSVDGSRVMELTQWQDQSSYGTFQTSLASGAAEDDYTKYYEKYADAKGGKGKGKPKDDEVNLGEPFLTATFAIDQVVSPPGMVSAIPGSMALVQLSDISFETPEQQLDLLEVAKATLAKLPQLYPSPRTAVLLRGIDTPHIALLSSWGSAAEFSDLALVPQISLAAAEGNEASFTTDSHLYQTVKVITPKPQKYGKE